MKHQNINVIENGIKITLNLGRQGEYNVRDIKFDMSDFQQKYGDGTATIVHYPANGSEYTVPSIAGDSKDSAILDNDTLTWTIGRLATRYDGKGIAEITWTTLEGLKKSVIYNTYCKEAIGDYGADRAAQQSYIDQMAELASTITDLSSEFSDAEKIAAEIVDARENAVSDIEALKNGAVSAVTTAKSESIEDIGDSKESALDALNTAKQTALTDIENAKQNAETDINAEILIAETHANNASQSATNASNSATNASNSADSADQSAASAQTSATNASNSAANASQYADNASLSANSASQSATSAQTSANNASTSEQNARQSAEDAQDILDSVQAEGNTQISRVQAKGDEIIASLPEDFTEVQQELSALNGSLGTLIDVVPTDTATGDIASFNDGADDIPVKNLTVNIEPIQNGTGDPSPDNIRPISGWTGTTITCNNKTINIGWADEAGAVYGGFLDVSTGVLTVTHAIKSFTSRINLHPNYPNAFYINSAFSDCGEGIPLCNMFSYGHEALHKMSPGKFGIDTNYTRLYFVSSAFSSTQEANAFFAENPLIVTYPLATPVTYQLTPQEVKTILGENNIFADTGDVSVEYRADIKKYIDKVVATAVSALS